MLAALIEQLVAVAMSLSFTFLAPINSLMRVAKFVSLYGLECFIYKVEFFYFILTNNNYYVPLFILNNEFHL